LAQDRVQWQAFLSCGGGGGGDDDDDDEHSGFVTGNLLILRMSKGMCS
jgi:hypothetical protein